ncbi:MAG: hypothetical protein JNM79_18995 [Burkholderiales bacterium]|nr:hypothetical protein [Burkholderiales bacterium]
MNSTLTPSMHDGELEPKGGAAGLAPEVKDRISATLSKMVPEWLAEPAADWKRVPRPTGVGGFSINVEAYQGVQSWISFRKKHVGTADLDLLDKLVREQQPELLGYVCHNSGSQLIQDCFALCSCLSREVALRIPEHSSIEAAIFSVISDLEKILTKRTGEREILTVLTGLKLPEGVERIDLDNGLYIRLLTADEIADLGSNDITSESRYDLTSRFVTAAVISETPISVWLTKTYENFVPDHSDAQNSQEQIGRILSALHIVKSGRVGVLASFTKIRPAILPNMSGHSSAPLVVNPFSFMELTHEDVARFVGLYKALAVTQRDELNIAAARLLDAESRMSPIDALLDAVIGLEALLNPNDRSELSFRVALNYAYLAPASERRPRYENVRDVQLSRNRVVHGGLNLRSKDAQLLHEHAELAKVCLRDAVARFLTDESLTGSRKLDADFWLDRVLPPMVEE